MALKPRSPEMAKALVDFAQKVQRTFEERLVALYIARHPSIEIEGYNALIVLREVRPGDQETAVRLAIESCRELDPDDQIAPLVVGEDELWVELGKEIISLPDRPWSLAARDFAQKVQRTFEERLVALYIARHPSIEIEGYNALIVLREVRPGDQETAVRLAIESCRELDPDDQIAPLVVGEDELEKGEIPSEFLRKV